MFKLLGNEKNILYLAYRRQYSCKSPMLTESHTPSDTSNGNKSRSTSEARSYMSRTVVIKTCSVIEIVHLY